MRSTVQKWHRNRRLAVVMLTLVLVCLPALSSGASVNRSTQPMMTIAITNNATRDIYHLYLSPVERDAWGPDLLAEGTVVKSGQTFTLSDVSCAGNEIKVVAEDKQGCFVYGIVGCAEASSSWTITDATPPDCGN